MDWWIVTGSAVGVVVGWVLREAQAVAADEGREDRLVWKEAEVQWLHKEVQRLHQLLDDRPFQEPFTLVTSGPMGELLSHMVYTPSPTPPSPSSTAPPAPARPGSVKPGPKPILE